MSITPERLAAAESENVALRIAIDALMAERRAVRAFAASIGLRCPRQRRHELSLEARRLEGEARRACATAGIRLKNNDEA